jgi:hypothetical protein
VALARPGRPGYRILLSEHHVLWNFEPAARIAYEATERFTPSLEYYSELGPLPAFLPIDEQVHQILPGGDLKLAKNLLWSFGVGIGTTPAGERLVYKSRFEFTFGRDH